TGTQKRTSSGDGGDLSPASGEADRENRDSGRRMSGDGDIGKHDDGALLSGAGRLDRIFFSLRAGDNRTGIFPGKGTGTGFCGRGVFYAGISNYVGGDIVSGLLLMDFYRKDEIGLFFDIGTNGE